MYAFEITGNRALGCSLAASRNVEKAAVSSFTTNMNEYDFSDAIHLYFHLPLATKQVEEQSCVFPVVFQLSKRTADNQFGSFSLANRLPTKAYLFFYQIVSQ